MIRIWAAMTMISTLLVLGCGDGGAEGDGPAPPVSEIDLQAALDGLSDGDTLSIAPGLYRQNLVVTGKVVHLQGIPGRSVIDGRGRTCITLNDASGASVTGLTLINGEDGISTDSEITITDNHFFNNEDGVDYEGGGGLLENNRFHLNRDDAVDLDQAVAVEILGNTILESGDDGIEIRLHPYAGETLTVRIQGNTIAANQANGLQIIDYEVATDRQIEVAGNTFIENGFSAIAFADNRETAPSFDIGSIDEPVSITENCFYPARFAFTGTGPRTRLRANTILTATGEPALNTTASLERADNLVVPLE